MNGLGPWIDRILAEERLRREHVLNRFAPFPDSFDEFYDVLAEREHTTQGRGDGVESGPFTYRAAVSGAPLNCLGRALTGLLAGVAEYGRDLRPVVEYMGGQHPVTGVVEESRQHVFLVDMTEPGEPVVYGEEKGLAGEETGNAEVLDGRGLYGLYCLSEAYNLFDPDAADRGGARAYQQTVEELGLPEHSNYFQQLTNSVNNNF